MRQFLILSYQPKLDIGLFVDLAEFPCFYAVLACPNHKIVLQIKAKQFYDQVMQELRKNREIQLNQKTIQCQVLAYLNKIWSCLIRIKLYRMTRPLEQSIEI